MRRLYIAIMLLGLILLDGCELFMEKVYFIYVINNSNYTLLVEPADGKSIIESYPDTLLPYSRPYLNEVRPNKQLKLESRRKWDDLIINYLPADTLSIYIFNADTVEICGWENVAKDYKVLKRYDLSVDDLIETNWTVTYP